MPDSWIRRTPMLEGVHVSRHPLVLHKLARGGSAVVAIDILKRWGCRRIKYVGLIAAPEGVATLRQAHPEVPIYLAALDAYLNEKKYIVPGLGDAGDRQFGTL